MTLKSRQLDLFADPIEERLERKYSQMEERLDKMRKSHYAHVNELTRLCKESQEEIERLKAAICKRNNNMESWLYK